MSSTYHEPLQSFFKKFPSREKLIAAMKEVKGDINAEYNPIERLEKNVEDILNTSKISPKLFYSAKVFGSTNSA